MIDISLRLAKLAEKLAVWTMLETYLDELSQLGTFDRSYPRFDLYWQEPERAPYWIEKAGQIVGLIFLNRQSFQAGPPIARSPNFISRPNIASMASASASCSKPSGSLLGGGSSASSTGM